MGNKRFIKALSVIFSICLAVCIFTACANDTESLKKEVLVMDEYFSYSGYPDYESALNASANVVYGTIKEIGEGYSTNYGIEGNPVFYYTPLTIEIEECIKGDSSEKTIVYNALGADINNVIYDYEAYNTLDYKVGDKILVFLSDVNECISPMCDVTEDDNGNATIMNLDTGVKNESLEEQVAKIKLVYEEMVKNTASD